jgi:putative colanic acid biosynthesis acetyltransferase WcaB
MNPESQSPAPPRFWSMVRADWAANPQNPKGRIILIAFRLAHWLRCKHRITFLLGLPYLVLYRVSIEWILGVEIPPLTKIGPGLALHHGQGLVINHRSIIGANCVLRHGTTLGNRGASDDRCPVLEDHVDVGASSILIGPIHIGAHTRIGAGSIVTKSFPPHSRIAGNPARDLRPA